MILASGLKYIGLSTTALGWSLFGVLLAGAGYITYQLRASAAAEAEAATATPAAPAAPAAPLQPVAPSADN